LLFRHAGRIFILFEEFPNGAHYILRGNGAKATRSHAIRVDLDSPMIPTFADAFIERRKRNVSIADASWIGIKDMGWPVEDNYRQLR
jgi:hypothetical protein